MFVTGKITRKSLAEGILQTSPALWSSQEGTLKYPVPPEKP
jgi:hypothetical protein